MSGNALGVTKQKVCDTAEGLALVWTTDGPREIEDVAVKDDGNGVEYESQIEAYTL